MKIGQSTYIGYLWSPSEEQAKLQEIMQAFPTTELRRYTSHTIVPPTYIKSNEFTYPL